ncbi:hypothetical protein [Variovorax sp. RA8]|uniref:hypothetical protein n=1 Tax=Variovorax sp. (strain JCM 16519 / RA8) TaxID=662548 RepID=UPI000A530219|nr:hypothetical protein [Variovorax sp. RA8]VTU13468.1 hypothetical protein RA8CHR_00104 [Variovorax sp. RA8]
MWAAAKWIDYDADYGVYMTCLEQGADGEEVFVTCQNTRERPAGDATEQAVLVALLAEARSGYFQRVIFHRVIVIK